MNSLINRIKESGDKSRLIFNNTRILLKDPLPENINIDEIVKKIESTIPSNFLYNIDMIYIGQFDILNDREVSAVYAEGAIYITNVQEDILDMIDDIVHEVAHSLEEEFSIDIYGDGQVEAEFLGKRNRLERIIKSQGYDILGLNFLESGYSRELDDFFYKELGYPLLSTFTHGLFDSAYSCTSIREYFANGFEEFYLRDRNYLNTISPKLYRKIIDLHNKGDQ